MLRSEKRMVERATGRDINECKRKLVTKTKRKPKKQKKSAGSSDAVGRGYSVSRLSCGFLVFGAARTVSTDAFGSRCDWDKINHVPGRSRKRWTTGAKSSWSGFCAGFCAMQGRCGSVR